MIYIILRVKTHLKLYRVDILDILSRTILIKISSNGINLTLDTLSYINLNLIPNFLDKVFACCACYVSSGGERKGAE